MAVIAKLLFLLLKQISSCQVRHFAHLAWLTSLDLWSIKNEKETGGDSRLKAQCATLHMIESNIKKTSKINS